MNEPVAEPARARFLMLCAEDRYAEAESMLAVVYPSGSMPGGQEVVAQAAFYEDWGDAVVSRDPAGARTAYAQAEELFATVASWASPDAEGVSVANDVDRVHNKQISVAT